MALTAPTPKHNIESVPADSGGVPGKLLGNFKSLKEATPEEFTKATAVFNACAGPEKMADRALKLLKDLDGVNCGNLLDMYQHGLQTATRAHHDGADEETIVVCLLHDIGEIMSPINHGEISAGLLRPYISPQNYWILMHHEIFQSHYYQDAAGMKVRNLRERFKDDKYFDACVYFCENYDQPSFDTQYENLPLEFFVPMVQRIFKRAPYWHPEHRDNFMNCAKVELGGGFPSGEDIPIEQATKKQKTSGGYVAADKVSGA